MKRIIIGLLIGLAAGAVIGYVQGARTSVEMTRTASASADALNEIRKELEGFHAVHERYPDSLAELDLDRLRESPKFADFADKVFYVTGDESYTLMIGIPSAAWVESGRGVRFR